MSKGSSWPNQSSVALWHLRFKITSHLRDFWVTFDVAESTEFHAFNVAQDLGQRMLGLLPSDAAITRATMHRLAPGKYSRLIPGVTTQGKYQSVGGVLGDQSSDAPRTAILFRLESTGGSFANRKFNPLPDEQVSGGKLVNTIAPVVGRPNSLPALPVDGDAWEEVFANFFAAIVFQTHHIIGVPVPGDSYQYFPWENCFPLRVGSKNGGRGDGQVFPWSGSAASKVEVPLRGLVGLYLFNEGAGSSAKDGSGLANHGVLRAGSAAPTWVPSGLSFDGNDGLDLPPSLLPMIRTVVFYGNISAPSAPGSFMSVLASTDANGLSWGTDTTSVNPPAPFLLLGNVGKGMCCQFDHYWEPGGNGMAWVQDGTLDALFINGHRCAPVAPELAGNDTSTRGRVGNLVFGNSLYMPGMVGVAGGLLLSSAALSDAEVLQAHQYLASKAASRGMAPYANSATGRLLWIEGDSISTDLSGTITSWPAVAQGLYSQAWTLTNNSYSGALLRNISQSCQSRTIQNFSPAATKNVVVFFAGTNDGLFGGSSPADTFGYLQNAVNAAISAGGQVVIVPMLSRVTLDGFKNSYNALIFGAAFGSSVYTVPLSAIPHGYPDGAYANATWFVDLTHPTQALANEIAQAVKTGIDGFA